MLMIGKKVEDLATKEEALEALKKTVELRNTMGGALYWNILNDEACQIANRCSELGVERAEITPLLGQGNFR